MNSNNPLYMRVVQMNKKMQRINTKWILHPARKIKHNYLHMIKDEKPTFTIFKSGQDLIKFRHDPPEDTDKTTIQYMSDIARHLVKNYVIVNYVIGVRILTAYKQNGIFPQSIQYRDGFVHLDFQLIDNINIDGYDDCVLTSGTEQYNIMRCPIATYAIGLYNPDVSKFVANDQIFLTDSIISLKVSVIGINRGVFSHYILDKTR
jgi:hypothetical protein